MKTIFQKSVFFCKVSAVTLFLACFLAVAPSYGLDIIIDVTPNTLNLQSEGELVTVHTNLAYEEVEGASVELNGVPIAFWKADNRGFFVAKFPMDLMKDIIFPDDDNVFLLTLEGTINLLDADGNIILEDFSCTEEIWIVDNDPVGKGLTL